jgi:hypothetical protein
MTCLTNYSSPEEKSFPFSVAGIPNCYLLISLVYVHIWGFRDCPNKCIFPYKMRILLLELNSSRDISPRLGYFIALSGTWKSPDLGSTVPDCDTPSPRLGSHISLSGTRFSMFGIPLFLFILYIQTTPACPDPCCWFRCHLYNLNKPPFIPWGYTAGLPP